MNQASGTTDYYFRAAIDSIAGMLGLECTPANRIKVLTDHPTLVAAHVASASNDFLASALTVAGERVQRGLGAIAYANPESYDS